MIPIALLCTALAAGTLQAPQAADAPAYQRATGAITLPDVTLVDQRGARVPLRKAMETDQVVVLQFVYGSNATLSPLLSASFEALQHSLGPRAAELRLVSVTVDPDHDSPQVGRDYLRRFQAQPGWDFLTGQREDILQILQAFAVKLSNKAQLYPTTYLRSPRDGRWTKITGLMTPTEFMNECKKAGLP